MQKIYTRINWKNEPDRTTALNENNLNRIDYAMDALDDRVIGLAGYEERAKISEETAKMYMEAAMQSEENALEYANASQVRGDERVALAEQHARMAESYTHGGTGQRENEAVDNAQYYLEQAKQLSQSMNGLIPMGTITFSDLSLEENQVGKYMFNISEDFVTDDTFKEGVGHVIPAGTNVFRTNDGYWDCLAGSFQTPNGDTKDNTVSFVQATTLNNITSGEKFSVIFGKIAKAIGDVISHLANSSNPHGVTRAQLGLQNIPANIKIDTAAQQSGTNLITSGGVYAVQQALNTNISDVNTNLTSQITNLNNAKINKTQIFGLQNALSGNKNVANSTATDMAVFTASTAGWYFFEAECNSSTNGVNAMIMSLYKGNSNLANTGGMLNSNVLVPYNLRISTMVYLAKGNAVSLKVIVNNTDVSSSNIKASLKYTLMYA